MVPKSIRSNLSSLRWRERLLGFVWGCARLFAVVIVLLLVCMLADWLIDRERDTPMFMRVFFVVLQISAWSIATILFLLWPQIRRLPDEMLALWVEARFKRFDHRLISAVQLNQPGAKLDGMSAELVQVMTREAEAEANRHRFASVANHNRFLFSVLLIPPVVLLFLVPFAIAPRVSFTLLARQALLDWEIPRSVYLENTSVAVWPVGDEVPIRYRVTGEWTDDMVGTIYVSPGGRFPLKFVEKDGDDAIFEANLDPGKIPAAEQLSFSARLADGRTREPSDMKLVHRPVITDNYAWLILPAYCDTRNVKDKVRYERPQPNGNVAGIPGSSVRVQFETQRPITRAWLELKGREFTEGKKPGEPTVREIDKGTINMALTKSTKVDSRSKETIDVWVAEARFDLELGLHGYVMRAVDEHGFNNIAKPPLSLNVVPEAPPQVVLLKDTFDLGEGSSFDLEGLPVVIGRQIRVPYRVDGAYGLSRARLLYRVLKKHESGAEPQEEEEWTKLELPEKAHPGAPYGEFNLQTGVFEGMQFHQQVSFYAIPSLDPARIMGRTVAGGRYFLETKDNALIDSKGKAIKLKAGDQVEYCVEVFAAEREPRASIPSARSESRVTTVMEEKEFTAWMRLVGQEDERVRLLEARQKAIFERK